MQTTMIEGRTNRAHLFFAFAAALTIVVAPALALAGEVWTIGAEIADGSTPPEDLVWNCLYDISSGIESCGGPFPVPSTVTVELPAHPSYVGSGNAYVVGEDGGIQYYYRGRLWSTYPGQRSFAGGLSALWGNAWGYVRLPGGTPLPGVIVAAYTLSGQLVNQATTDENGRYQFTKENATELDQQNHWVLPVDSYDDAARSFDARSYYLVPSAMDAVAPDDLRNPWKRKVVVGASHLVQQDIVVGQVEDGEDSNEHDDDCDEETPEDDQDRTCVPAGEGEPVHLVTGSAYLQQGDATLRGVRRTLSMTRRYNSRRAYFGKAGAFGKGWTHSYEKSVTEVLPGLLRLNKGDAAPVYLQDSGNGVYRAELPLNHTSWVEKTADGYVRHFRQGGTETYDSAGLLVQQQDRVGNATTIERDGEGKMVALAAPGGRSLTFSYQGSHVSAVTGPEGLIASYSYQGDVLDRVTYAGGSGYTFSYDDSGELLAMRDLSGTTLETHTFAGGRALTSERAAGNEHLSFTYQRPAEGAHATVVNDSVGGVRTYTIGDRGGIRSVTAERNACPSCDGGAVSNQWQFDGTGRLLGSTVSDASMGSGTVYERDARGFVSAVVARDGSRVEYTRDDYGRPLTRAGAVGTDSWTYGAAGPLTVTDAEHRTTTFQYDERGLVAVVTDPAGRRTRYGYSDAGDLTSITDALEHQWTIERDAMGRTTAVIDPTQKRMGLHYDTSGRVDRVTLPGELAADLTRDSQGRITRASWPDARVTNYRYSDAGQLVGVQDGTTGTIGLQYDAASRPSAVIDGRGNTWRYGYDTLGRVSRETSPDGRDASTSYDAAGRIVQSTGRNGIVTRYDYDAVGRLTRIRFSDGTPALRYGYDAVGRLTSAANGSDTLTWTYDASGRVLAERSTRNGTTVSYSYAPDGRRRSLSLDGGLVASYTPDEVGRLATISFAGGEFHFGYDTAGRRTELTAPNGVVTRYNYDDALRLTEVASSLNSAVTASTLYGFDAASNVVSKETAGGSETYSYDLLDRLTAAVSPAAGRTEWTYDAAGNRITVQNGATVSRYTFDTNNRLKSRDAGGSFVIRGSTDEPSRVTVNGQLATILPGNVFEARIAGAPGTTRVVVDAVDASGNSRHSEYDVDLSANAAQYRYDPAGNLVEKTEDATWTYEWNGLGSSCELPEMVFRRPPSSTTPSVEGSAR